MNSTLGTRQLTQALENAHITYFSYFPQERLVTVPDGSRSEWGSEARYENAPFSIADSMVAPSERGTFVSMYRSIDLGMPVAAGVFKLLTGAWCRVTMTTVEWVSEGVPRECLCIVENLSDAKRAELELTSRNKALGLAAQMFQTAAEATDVTVFIFDLERQSILVNGSTADAWGVLEEQPGVPYETAESGIVPPASRDEYIRVHEEMMAGAPSASARVMLKRADGHTGYYELLFRALVDGLGNPTGKAVGVYRDITKFQEDYLHQHAMARALTDGIVSAYFIDLDRDTFVAEDLTEDLREPVASFVNAQAQCYSDTIRAYCDKFVHEDDREAVLHALARETVLERLATRPSFFLQYRVKSNDEGLGFFEVHVSDATTIDGARQAFMSFRCIDEQKTKELEQQRALANALEEARVFSRRARENLEIVNDLMGSGMWYMEFDMEGALQRCVWSPAFRSMLGFESEEEFPNALESWSGRLHPEDRDAVLAAYWDCVAGKGPYDVRYRLKKKDGTYTWYRSAGKVVRYRSGAPRLFAGTFIDITGAIERERVKRALEDAFEAAKRANDAKSKFLSSMSHDIRTPMNAILGMTAIARSHMDEPERVADCLDKIGTAGRHLLGLINEVLDMSKIESGRLDINRAEFELADLLGEVAVMSRSQADARGHRFSVEVVNLEHGSVVGDSQRIKQAVMNLVSNAIKYTPDGGEVSLRLEEKPTNRERRGCYEFTVTDNGIGIDAEFLARIFEPFTRARDPRVERSEGTGLGLAIAKNIVTLMGGDIAVDSEPEVGTTVSVTLYLEFQEVQRPQVPRMSRAENSLDSMASQDFSGKRVLLVEDNLFNVEVASEALQMARLDVEVASNGREAWEMMRAAEDAYYDLVFMDIQMPVMNGHEAARAIRAESRPYLREVPIVAMTADAFAEDVEAARLAGMNGHLAKPLDFGQLAAVLNRWLG